MDLHNIRATLLSITPGKKSSEYAIAIALNEEEHTYTARVNEAGGIPVMGFDFVFDLVFNRNQQVVDQVVKAVYAYRAGKSVSLPIDLGQYYLR